MVRHESGPSPIRHITPDTKQTGAPSAGNLHAGCDAAGAGNGFTVRLMRHSQRKRGATDRLDLRNTAPVLDPTPLRSPSIVVGLAGNASLVRVQYSHEASNTARCRIGTIQSPL